MKLRVGLIQLAVRDGEPYENLAHMRSLLDDAPGADLYLLPELWTTGYAHASWGDVADDATPDITRVLQQIARDRRAWLGGSQVSRTPEGGLVNRFWLFGPAREIAAYDKGHLFPPMREAELLQAGTRRQRVQMDGWTAALSVCFDLRFPEMYRLDALSGANLFLVVSAWPAVRAEVQRVLARARAIENQAFLVLCNRTGSGADGTRFNGGSLVVAPDGALLANAGQAERTMIVDLEAPRLEQARVPHATLSLRRPGLDWVPATPSPLPEPATEHDTPLITTIAGTTMEMR
jgi:omega-amidase